MVSIGKTLFLKLCYFITYSPLAWVIESDLGYVCTFSCLPSLVRALILFETAAASGTVTPLKAETFNSI